MMKEYVKRYVYYTVLLVITCILFMWTSYENLNKNNEVNFFRVDNDRLILKNELVIDEKKYISYEDIQSFVGEDIYLDKISRKIILTSIDSIRKYELNNTQKEVNFEIKDTEKAIYIKRNGKDYLMIDEIANMYNYQLVYNEKLNSLDFVTQTKVEGILESNRVYGYLEKNKKNSKVILTDNNIEVVKNEEFLDNQSKYYTVIVKQNEQDMLLYVLKNDIKIQDKVNNIDDTEEQEFRTMFFNENNNNNNTLDNVTNSVILDGLKLINKEGLIENTIDTKVIEQAKSNNKQVYISLDNGYTSSNYNNGVTMQMLQSDTARKYVITSVANAIKDSNIDGVVVNFRQLNSSGKEDFTQFIKEISAYLHGLNIKTLVYVPFNSSYIDLESITVYSDLAILIQYGTKEITSKVSGTHSGINWIEVNLEKLKQDNIDLSKIIMEIPLYSIIWTEKNNKVIDAEKINMKALEDYIMKNKLITKLDETSKQNYVEFVQGSLKYKIWLEDNYSVKQKIQLAKEYGLAGISLYKKGYESQSFLRELGGN